MGYRVRSTRGTQFRQRATNTLREYLTKGFAIDDERVMAGRSIDYDNDAPITQEFTATVRSKLHWAIHGRTDAEIITERADATKPNMGLMTWKNAPGGPDPQGRRLDREELPLAEGTRLFLNRFLALQLILWILFVSYAIIKTSLPNQIRHSCGGPWKLSK